MKVSEITPPKKIKILFVFCFFFGLLPSSSALRMMRETAKKTKKLAPIERHASYF